MKRVLIDKQLRRPKNFKLAKTRLKVTVGESLRILREFNELSQSALAVKSGVAQATISAIENGRVTLGLERAKTFARVLRCHPAVLVFPGWDIETESRAA